MAFAKKTGSGGGRGRGGSSSRTGGGAAAGGDRGGAAGGQRRSLFRRRKVCKFCADKIDDINYKDVKLLQGFVPERAKVLPRRISGTCAKHQRKLRVAIMRARVLALLPYAAE
jgi:small subunit ribosomal protein S18